MRLIARNCVGLKHVKATNLSVSVIYIYKKMKLQILQAASFCSWQCFKSIIFINYACFFRVSHKPDFAPFFVSVFILLSKSV